MRRVSHQAFSDLRLYLVSPKGTEVMIADGTNAWGTSGDAFTWSFGLEAFRGENAAGTWTLRMEDALPDFGGTLHWVDLDLHGREIQADDVYHYTDEFGAMAGLAAQNGRRSLADADGGADWINAAAVTGDAVVSLAAGSTSALAGSSFAIAAGTQIEHAVTGDGNDTITGNGAANRLLGMRGNDALAGEGGDDTLQGGRGTDLLLGGEGADRYVFVALEDSRPGAGDVIADFVRGADLIDVSAIDTSAAAGDQGFAWLGTGDFTGQGMAEARYHQDGFGTQLDFDAGDGGVAEMSIRLAGLHSLEAGDLLL